MRYDFEVQPCQKEKAIINHHHHQHSHNHWHHHHNCHHRHHHHHHQLCHHHHHHGIIGLTRHRFWECQFLHCVHRFQGIEGAVPPWQKHRCMSRMSIKMGKRKIFNFSDGKEREISFFLMAKEVGFSISLMGRREGFSISHIRFELKTQDAQYKSCIKFSDGNRERLISNLSPC